MRISEKPLSEYPFFVRIILWAQKKKYGESLLPSKIWGRSPKLMYGLQAFYRAVDRKSSPIEPALRSLIGVKVSQINNCDFCVDISSALLKKRGISIEKISALPDHQNSGLFSEKENVVLKFAEAVTIHDQAPDEKLFAQLKLFFTDDEIVELTALIAYQNLSSKFNAALQIPAQGFCVKE